ncbi:MAG: chemotaxis protein CheW [Neptuniibacter sp.]
MSIDLSQFVATFLEESYEGLEVMESSLLNLDSADEETINTIFRAAHSIKGGSGTFGFAEVADFTHIVETLLDALRSGQQEVTPDLINLLLESVDCIKALLEASQDGPEADAAMIQNVHDRLEQALSGEAPATSEPATAAPVAVEPATVPEEPEPVGSVDAQGNAWNISFVPNADLLQAGHEPAFMFEALAELGELTAKPLFDKLPQLSALNPEEIYLSWELLLVSECDESEIQEIFEWVEDECKLEITRGTSDSAQSVSSSSVDSDQGWQIKFVTDESFLATGNEPSFMFEALTDLGELTAKPNLAKLPDFKKLDPEKLYLDWDLTLKSACSEEEVTEIFEWVEDVSSLEIAPLAAVSEPAAAVEPEPEITEEDVPVQSAAEPEVATVTPQEASSTTPVTPAPPEPSAPPAAAKPAAKASAATPKKAASKPAAESSSIRVDTDKIDALINRVGELVITQAMLGQVGDELAEIVSGSELERLQTGLDQLERNTRDLQEDVMRVRMLPISFVFNRFPRLVHDVSGKLGKKVELVITGENTEIDKTVMKKLGDPMVHLIRNSLDHGLETPEERLAAGKSEVGKVQLDAYHQGGYIIIDIIDDGRGVNTQKVYEKALANGLITADQQLSDDEINELIFRPGFSTADAVSDLSGRGVGMDVVRRNIESLGGYVQVKSEPGFGSKFSVSLPLTLAILDGQLIRVDQETYIIPLISIVETILADKNTMSSIAGEDKLLHFRDEYIPLIHLRSLFKLPPESDQSDSLIAIVENGGQKVGLVVDELYGQQQVVIKSLEVNFKRIEGFAGATILGDGSVALILDIAGLMKLGLDQEAAAAAKKRNEIFNNSQGAIA